MCSSFQTQCLLYRCRRNALSMHCLAICTLYMTPKDKVDGMLSLIRILCIMNGESTDQFFVASHQSRTNSACLSSFSAVLNLEHHLGAAFTTFVASRESIAHTSILQLFSLALSSSHCRIEVESCVHLFRLAWRAFQIVGPPQRRE